jgi:hypothetical protein
MSNPYTYRDYIEVMAIFIVMTVVYIFIINPLLLDVAPILAFQSSEGFDRRSGGLGQLSYIVTVVAGVFIYYLIIRYTIEVGFIPLLASIHREFLILIPNQFLPERLHPENMKDLAELEERYREKPGLIERLISYIFEK